MRRAPRDSSVRTRLRRTRRRTMDESARLLRRLAASAAGMGVSAAGRLVLSSALEFTPLGECASGFAQAGGHAGAFVVRGALLEKAVCEREAAFYEAAARGRWPRHFLPEFAGRSADGRALRLENLTHGLGAPCVVDLKMGFQSVEAGEASLRKRLRHGLLDRVTGSAHAGVRVEGIALHRARARTRVKGSRKQTHSTSSAGVSLQDVLAFFLSDEGGVRADVALRLRAHIEALLLHFRRQTDFLFIGSSVLLIYDNDNCEPHMRWARALQRLHTVADIAPISPGTIAPLTRRTPVDVRMIDFAHTGPNPNAPEIDEGYIAGLESILAALTAISDRREHPIADAASAAMQEQRAAAADW